MRRTRPSAALAVAITLAVLALEGAAFAQDAPDDGSNGDDDLAAIHNPSNGFPVTVQSDGVDITFGRYLIVGSYYTHTRNSGYVEHSRSRFFTACTTPCTIYLPPGDHHFTTLAGFAGGDFTLSVDAEPRSVVLHVPSAGYNFGGALLVGFGACAALLGTVMVPVGIAVMAIPPAMPMSDYSPTLTGLAIGGVGVGLVTASVFSLWGGVRLMVAGRVVVRPSMAPSAQIAPNGFVLRF